MIKKRTLAFAKRLKRQFRDCISWSPWANECWSQEGEDQILRRIFGNQKLGFYIDVGAHHPIRFSNTYLFYRKGWSGINVDAAPDSMVSFDKKRPRDINLEVGIGKVKRSENFYIFNEPALNTFSERIATSLHEAESKYRIKEVVKVEVLPLSQILDRHLPKSQRIDFLNVDVEGMDFEVLDSNNWDKYKPKIILAESRSSDIDGAKKSPLGELLLNNGYNLYAKTMNTLFFKARDFPR